jgi:DNA polymerase III epsilon subunit-like protein
MIQSEKYLLFIDTETTGLPITKSYDDYFDPKETQYYDQSRIIDIGYVICNENNKLIKKVKNLIKPNNFTISNSHIHGITNDKAIKKGIDINNALDILNNDLENVNTIIAHNSIFDINVILSECYRNNKTALINNINSKSIKCTKKMGQKFMNSYKAPKLVELYKYLFNEDIIQKHRALADAKLCQKCYFKIK